MVWRGIETNYRIEWVLPEATHAQLLMQWRNDPTTLAMSFHQEPKQWESFYPEFLNTYFSQPALPPIWIVSPQGEREAFVRFRQWPPDSGKSFFKQCELSIHVAPEARGKGVGQIALTLAHYLLKQQGYDQVLAEVKPENSVSHRLFQRLGYQRLQDYQKEVDGQYFTVTQYGFALRSAPVLSDRVYIIAEAGSNWRMGTEKRDIAMAKALIDAACDAGADAVKFQTYRPETVYVENAGQSEYLAAAGIKESIRDIFADLAMPYEMLATLAEYCKEKHIDFMSTPFSLADFQAVDPFVSCHKLASYELSHLRLLEAAAHSGKPLILSTGAASEADIQWAVDTFYAAGGRSLTLLQCTAKYPAPDEAMNLSAIPWLKQRFGVPVGLSDHSRDRIMAPTMAVAYGASVIEKHFTLSNHLPGPDHSFAITNDELKQMVDAIRRAEAMAGDGMKQILPQEQELFRYARRAIQATRPIQAGEQFQEGVNIAILRPGEQQAGCHPQFLQQIEGQRAKRNIALGEGVQVADAFSG